LNNQSQEFYAADEFEDGDEGGGIVDESNMQE
jgi:hypothetical protein